MKEKKLFCWGALLAENIEWGRKCIEWRENDFYEWRPLNGEITKSDFEKGNRKWKRRTNGGRGWKKDRRHQDKNTPSFQLIKETHFWAVETKTSPTPPPHAFPLHFPWVRQYRLTFTNIMQDAKKIMLEATQNRRKADKSTGYSSSDDAHSFFLTCACLLPCSPIYLVAEHLLLYRCWTHVETQAPFGAP